MKPLIITIEIEPQGQGRARARYVQPRGRPGFTTLYTSSATRKYEAELAKMAALAMRGRQIFDGPLTVLIDAVFSVPRSWSGAKCTRAIAGVIRPTGKPDASNACKSVEDAFNKIVWRDDATIVDLRIRKFYGVTPGLTITVRHTEPLLLERDDAA